MTATPHTARTLSRDLPGAPGPSGGSAVRRRVVLAIAICALLWTPVALLAAGGWSTIRDVSPSQGLTIGIITLCAVLGASIAGRLAITFFGRPGVVGAFSSAAAGAAVFYGGALLGGALLSVVFLAASTVNAEGDFGAFLAGSWGGAAMAPFFAHWLLLEASETLLLLVVGGVVVHRVARARHAPES